MKIFFLFLLVLGSKLQAERFAPDPSVTKFEMSQPKKQRVDIFDFAGDFPQLENIDIDARRKKNVEFYLTGEYPLLETVNYEGTFGFFKGKITGNFPQLSLINFLCTSCAMQFDLGANWQQSCQINIRGSDEDIVITLPKDVGLVIHTKTSLKGKVIVCEELKKKGWFKILNKTYKNELADTASVVLTIDIEAQDGSIVLN